MPKKRKARPVFNINPERRARILAGVESGHVVEFLAGTFTPPGSTRPRQGVAWNCSCGASSPRAYEKKEGAALTWADHVDRALRRSGGPPGVSRFNEAS